MTTTVGKKSFTFSSGSFSLGSGRRIGGTGSSSMSFRSSAQPRAFSSHSMHSYGARPQASLRSWYGGYQAVGSAWGSGGRFGSGISSSSMSMMPAGSVFNNEKDTMQNLNQRLSIYLEKVQSLETSNSELERQIREIVASKTIDSFDWSIYNTTVKPLQQQIFNSILLNSRIVLETDNAKLAADDFRNKWESELMLRQSVENDIDGLHQLKDTYLQLKGNLTNEIDGLEVEIAYLRKNHEEELRLLRQQQTHDVQVEVDSVPSIDLTASLKELRDRYSKIADQNQKELDAWYKQQVAIKVTETTQTNQALVGAKGELSQYRHQLQSLEAEYNSLSGNLAALQNTLNDTEGRYAMEHQQILARVSHLEGELGGIRNDLMRQNQDYQILLNYKMKLEAEIQQYKLLLEGGNQSLVQSGSFSSISLSGRTVSQSNVVTDSSSITTKIVTEQVNRY
ncbi:keratin, type I cytoskeletal 18-like isoform X2 [Heptranchias perlo]|uniref:keratin, type I cytoskeletal 18-like isoform X2 n=1 Tax=Heptranchias perlo TaxID=212740 RepID=UPI00355A6528